jgi:hypothetical protein
LSPLSPTLAGFSPSLPNRLRLHQRPASPTDVLHAAHFQHSYRLLTQQRFPFPGRRCAVVATLPAKHYKHLRLAKHLDLFICPSRPTHTYEDTFSASCVLRPRPRLLLCLHRSISYPKISNCTS